MIDGVIITKLKMIPDERGTILHMLKKTDAHFKEFGEVYFSTIYPGAVKGWHKHKTMTINYAVPHGMIKLVMFDVREDSPTKGELQEVFLGERNHCLVTVPPGVWNGFKNICTKESIVANCATIAHDPSDSVRMDPWEKNIINYDWDRKDC